MTLAAMSKSARTIATDAPVSVVGPGAINEEFVSVFVLPEERSEVRTGPPRLAVDKPDQFDLHVGHVERALEFSLASRIRAFR